MLSNISKHFYFESLADSETIFSKMAKGLKSFLAKPNYNINWQILQCKKRVEVLGREKEHNLKQIGQGVCELCSDIQKKTPIQKSLLHS